MIKEIPVKKNQPLSIRIPAQFISYIFHPLFIPLYVIYFIVYIHPSYLSGYSSRQQFQLMMIIAINAVIFPLIAVLLLKGVGFIQSIYLHTQKDRIIPYIASGIFFFWTFQVCRNYPGVLPEIITSFMLGVFLTSSAALIANIYFKISMHAMGVGGMLGLFLIIMINNTMLMTWPLCIVLLITGLVCTSRLLLNNHIEKDIYAGLFLGIICQFIAAIVI